MDENNNVTGGSGGADMFDMLLKNPELISKVSSLLSGLKLSGTGGVPAENTPPDSSGRPAGAAPDIIKETPDKNPAKEPAGSSDITGRLSSLLANKELMSMLPGILSALKPSSPPGKPEGDAVPAGALIPAHHHHPKHGVDKRNALVIALKPYLNRRRREAVDYIIRLEKLGDVFRTLT